MKEPSYKSLVGFVLVICVVIYVLSLINVIPLVEFWYIAAIGAAVVVVFCLPLIFFTKKLGREMDEEGPNHPPFFTSPIDLPEEGKADLARRRKARKDEIVSELRSVGRLAQKSEKLLDGTDTGTARIWGIVLGYIVRLRWRRLSRRLNHRAFIKVREVQEARSRLDQSQLESSTPLASVNTESSDSSKEHSSHKPHFENADEYQKALKDQLAAQPPREMNAKLTMHGTHHVKNEFTGQLVNPVQPVSERAQLAGLFAYVTLDSVSRDHLVAKVYGDVEEIAWLLIDLGKRGLEGFTVESENEDDVLVFEYLLPAVSFSFVHDASVQAWRTE